MYKNVQQNINEANAVGPADVQGTPHRLYDNGMIFIDHVTIKYRKEYFFKMC